MANSAPQLDGSKSELLDSRKVALRKREHVIVHFGHPDALGLSYRVRDASESLHFATDGCHITAFDEVGDLETTRNEQRVSLSETFGDLGRFGGPAETCIRI